LITGLSHHWLIIVATLALIMVIYALPFEWIERLFGFAGCLMLTFTVVAIAAHPDWREIGRSTLPALPLRTGKSYLLYAYFAVGILSALMMPYEVHFYASGAVEEGWKPKDIAKNIAIAIVGFALGAVVAISLLVIGAVFLEPRNINPQLLGTAGLPVASFYGRTGLLIALIGMFFSIAGAAAETGVAAAYDFCQFFGYKWGRHRKPRETPVFTAAWIIVFLASMALVLTGIDPIQLVEYSVIFAVVVLPMTYLTILLAARDKKIMGKHVNTRWADVLGWAFFIIVSVAGLAALPLMILTDMGNGS
jgi:Mn2+/Fe2+ NRAMP family transporter